MTALGEIARKLAKFGHFNNPKNKKWGDSWNVPHEDVDRLSVHSSALKEAISSFQDFNDAALDHICMQMHGRPSIPDGELGPATAALLDMPRCEVPDYAFANEEAEAIGTGSWPAGCHPDWKSNHVLTVNVDKSGMRDFLKPHFDKEIWPAVVNAFADVGLLLIREDGNTRANLQTRFVRPDGNWLGLAIVPSRPRCGDVIWNHYDQDWRPSNLAAMWTTLLLHELGHNARLNHSRGGIMNAYLLSGLPASWKNDVSLPALSRHYGGERVPIPKPGPAVWTHQCLRDANTGEELCFPFDPPLPRL